MAFEGCPEEMEMSYRALDIMTPDLITVRSDMDVRELARLFLEKQILPKGLRTSA